MSWSSGGQQDTLLRLLLFTAWETPNTVRGGRERRAEQEILLARLGKSAHCFWPHCVGHRWTPQPLLNRREAGTCDLSACQKEEANSWWLGGLCCKRKKKCFYLTNLFTRTFAHSHSLQLFLKGLRSAAFSLKRRLGEYWGSDGGTE